jgi:hypothetical protein
LDVAKSRVVDCLQRVEDLLDLRLCTEGNWIFCVIFLNYSFVGVQAAMQQEDYEQVCDFIFLLINFE